jgi:tetratricopeptide (TPR) repeat protein
VPEELGLEDALLHAATELDQGAQAAEYLAELFPAGPQAILAQVSQLLARDELEAASELFSRVPEVPLSPVAVSVACLLDDFLALALYDPQLTRHRAQVCETLEAGLWKETQSWVRRTLARWPGDVPTLNNLSQLRFYQNRLPEARAIAEEVLAEDPHNVNALSNLVRFSLSSGRPDDAREYGRRLS